MTVNYVPAQYTDLCTRCRVSYHEGDTIGWIENVVGAVCGRCYVVYSNYEPILYRQERLK